MSLRPSCGWTCRVFSTLTAMKYAILRFKEAKEKQSEALHTIRSFHIVGMSGESVDMGMLVSKIDYIYYNLNV